MDIFLLLLFLAIVFFITYSAKNNSSSLGVKNHKNKGFSFNKNQRSPVLDIEFYGKPVVGIFELNSPKEYLHKYYFFATEINDDGASGYAHAKHTGYKRGHWTYVFAKFDVNGNLINKPSANKTNYKPVPYSKIIKEVSLSEFEENPRTSRM